MSDSLWPHEWQYTRPPFHHQLPEFTETHVYWVCDNIQQSHPPSSLSPPALNLSQHQSFQMSQLFTSGGQNIGVSASTSVLPMNTQHWSPLGWTGGISFQSKGLSKVFSGTIVWKHQFFYAQPSLWSNTHICTLNPNPWSELTLDNKMNTLILFFDFLSNHLLHLSKVPKCP